MLLFNILEFGPYLRNTASEYIHSPLPLLFCFLLQRCQSLILYIYNTEW
jgi:hypothetical protein